jgi:Winged helix-turn-helix DNA-binding
LSIYDFSDPLWTDKAVKDEYRIINDWLAKSYKAVDGSLTPEQLRIRQKYERRAEELEHEAEQRFSNPSGSGTLRPGKPRKARKPRGKAKPARLAPLGPYAPVPRAITKDAELPLAAKGFAAVIADLINLGKWNTDLHVDISYRELAERTGVNRETLMSHAGRLREAGYLATESLNRGGVRFKFTDHRSEKPA